ncbi:MAG: hypothetical protein J6Y82_02555 [Bacteroidales bacterium]|nr:hypothetical protein [Bacteroidales bacterium]
MRILAILLFVLSAAMAAGQEQRVFVKIEHANFLRHDDKVGKNSQSLNGDVMLSHHNTIMYCDSAYMFNDSNMVIAYSNVHVVQNDSIHLYGNTLTYYGDRNLAEIREDVRANKGDTWLYTENLDYDRELDKAYYYDGGKVVNLQNELTSENGLYFPNTNEVFFKNNVVGTSPNYTMYSDTMSFNTQTQVTTILGPTRIINRDSTIIDSELGWYDTKSDCAKLLQNNNIQSGAYNVKGDEMLYERRNGNMTVWGNMVINDTIDNLSLCGDYGFYNEQTNEALATRKALAIHVYGGDSLFVHADTFRIVPLPADSSRLIQAYYNVKYFRPDMQGRCDSLIFDFRDTVATLYKQPIVWATGNQMTAQTIKLYSKNRVLYKAELIESAFAISIEEDSLGFNQVKGKLMTGHIRNNELYKIDVSGNGQTIYYPKDGRALIGINRAESSNMSIWLKDKRIKNITMRESPQGNMNPPLLLGEKDRKLSGFRWLDDYRPKSKTDIFLPLDIPDDMNVKEEVFEGYTFDELGE